MNNFIEFLKNDVFLFDIVFVIIILFNTIKCFSQGFSLSFLSALKWIISIITTIILVPQLQPWVSNYIESDFINSVGISVLVFIVSLFICIVLSKSIGTAVKWTGFGSVDKSFGILFGLFQGYVVAVCFFSILNWFYSYEKWNISTESTFSFNIVKKGSDLLIEEFPNFKDIIDAKEKIEKI